MHVCVSRRRRKKKIIFRSKFCVNIDFRTKLIYFTRTHKYYYYYYYYYRGSDSFSTQAFKLLSILRVASYVQTANMVMLSRFWLNFASKTRSPTDFRWLWYPLHWGEREREKRRMSVCVCARACAYVCVCDTYHVGAEVEGKQSHSALELAIAYNSSRIVGRSETGRVIEMPGNE